MYVQVDEVGQDVVVFVDDVWLLLQWVVVDGVDVLVEDYVVMGLVVGCEYVVV